MKSDESHKKLSFATSVSFICHKVGGEGSTMFSPSFAASGALELRAPRSFRLLQRVVFCGICLTPWGVGAQSASPPDEARGGPSSQELSASQESSGSQEGSGSQESSESQKSSAEASTEVSAVGLGSPAEEESEAAEGSEPQQGLVPSVEDEPARSSASAQVLAVDSKEEEQAREDRLGAEREPDEEPEAAPKEKGGFLDHFFGSIRVRGYTQFRFNAPTTNERLVNVQGDRSMGGTPGFMIRRARLVLQGEIHPQLSIYLQPDFASSTESGQHFVQMRDWYVDLSDASKQFRLRVGQSKVPFGFENLQSSQNRLPLDRSDALNSAVVNERDLGVFFYYAPTEVRERFKHLVSSGLKGSGDYGVVALGVYNGQTANRPELNSNKHVVARVSYPFQLGDQILEVGGGGYAGKYVLKKDEQVQGPEEVWDARGNVSVILYPQPLGIQAEYNVGYGPELRNITETITDAGSVFRGQIEERFLHGGYVLLSYRIQDLLPGVLFPYARGILYEGGKKHETNAPRYSVRELEVGLEWQPFPALEFVAAFTSAERTYSKFPYQSESGHLGRFQVQVNY